MADSSHRHDLWHALVCLSHLVRDRRVNHVMDAGRAYFGNTNILFAAADAVDNVNSLQRENNIMKNNRFLITTIIVASLLISTQKAWCYEGPEPNQVDLSAGQIEPNDCIKHMRKPMYELQEKLFRVSECSYRGFIDLTNDSIEKFYQLCDQYNFDPNDYMKLYHWQPDDKEFTRNCWPHNVIMEDDRKRFKRVLGPINPQEPINKMFSRMISSAYDTNARNNLEFCICSIVRKDFSYAICYMDYFENGADLSGNDPNKVFIEKFNEIPKDKLPDFFEQFDAEVTLAAFKDAIQKENDSPKETNPTERQHVNWQDEMFWCNGIDTSEFEVISWIVTGPNEYVIDKSPAIFYFFLDNKTPPISNFE